MSLLGRLTHIPKSTRERAEAALARAELVVEEHPALGQVSMERTKDASLSVHIDKVRELLAIDDANFAYLVDVAVDDLIGAIVAVEAFAAAHGDPSLSDALEALDLAPFGRVLEEGVSLSAELATELESLPVAEFARVVHGVRPLQKALLRDLEYTSTDYERLKAALHRIAAALEAAEPGSSEQRRWIGQALAWAEDRTSAVERLRAFYGRTRDGFRAVVDAEPVDRDEEE